MRTRTIMTILVALMVNAVVFGTGAIIVLTVPPLRDHLTWLLPSVVVASLLATPWLSWKIAPYLRSRNVYRSGKRGEIFR
ncbi:hypothetical protein [Salaquimonas pukyongi]|uniref:hypothetical protein n=1 Tax=Salaquimonas pukyongi TaxID=2712698 RepID=UPI00096B997D|nr:hypothetical protein [Salaquimonas pukyongi]